MTSMIRTRLLSKQSKKIESKFVTFYKTVGEMVSLNSKTTEIFAYLKIYDSLTQEQLKDLTGFSLATISKILQLFLETGIVSRQFLPGTHKNQYTIKSEGVNFVYTPSTKILENLEALDSFIVDKQTDLQRLQKKYPVEIEFLHMRFNSLRNYIEAQRRQISSTKRYSFFQEDTSEIFPLNVKVNYPFETRKLEEELMAVWGHFKNDPIKNRLMSIFFTHRSIDQQSLVDVSGFSRSTVSRFLQKESKGAYIHALPREHRKPRIYYLNSISSSILSVILNTDNFIYFSIPKFKEMLSTIESRKLPNNDATFLVAKIRETIEKIETFERETRFLREAYQELSMFLRDTKTKN